jgi:hypothetical protein
MGGLPGRTSPAVGLGRPSSFVEKSSLRGLSRVYRGSCWQSGFAIAAANAIGHGSLVKRGTWNGDDAVSQMLRPRRHAG